MRFQGNDEQERALSAYVKLLRASNSVTATVMQQGLGTSHLTPTQFAVLEALYHSATEGTMCLGDIAQKILTSSGNLTLVVKNLERRGLAKRKPSGKDRRYVGLEITPRGAKLMREIFPAHLAAIVAAIQRLSPAEQEQLAALCKKLGGAESPSDKR
jgi:MarR family 2-MHQ and catechol resistance regulon transcriptional repressor